MEVVPDIHRCCQLYDENAKLRKKVNQLRKEIDELRVQVTVYMDKEKERCLLRDMVTTRNTYTQTEGVRYGQTHLSLGIPAINRKPQKSRNDNLNDQYTGDRVNKLLEMHNNLMKRYEKELKSNVQHVDTITTLNLKVNDLEQKVRSTDMHAQQLELKNKKLKLQAQGLNEDFDGDTSEERDVSGLLAEIRLLRKERNRLLHDRKKFKEELKGLDKGFFDEIEDIKYALQQSARLNKGYESVLKNMCHKFGVPYPSQQQLLTSQLPTTA